MGEACDLHQSISLVLQLALDKHNHTAFRLALSSLEDVCVEKVQWCNSVMQGMLS